MRTFPQVLLIMVATLSITGCRSFRGLKHAKEAQPVTVRVDDTDCAVLKFGRMKDRQQAEILAAFEDVCRIVLKSPPKPVLLDRKVLRTANGITDTNRAEFETTAAQVLEDVRHELAFSRQGSPLHLLAVRRLKRELAKTWTSERAISIKPKQIRAGRDELVNTIAHELTHIVPDDEAPKYLDEGHKKLAECDRLASYHVGDVVESTYCKACEKKTCACSEAPDVTIPSACVVPP